MSRHSIVVGRFVFGDSEVFSVVQTNNIEEFFSLDKNSSNSKNLAQEHEVYSTFSKGRLFHDEKEAAWDAYSLSKEVCLSVTFVDFEGVIPILPLKTAEKLVEFAKSKK